MLSLSLCQIYLRFLEYQMENSNECKKNFVAVYDGSSAIEDLKVGQRDCQTGNHMYLNQALTENHVTVMNS